MEFEKLEKQLLATAKAFRAFKTEFGYGKSGEELLKPFFRSLEESLGAVETEFDFLIGKDTVNIDGKKFRRVCRSVRKTNQKTERYRLVGIRCERKHERVYSVVAGRRREKRF